jgi:hypothetical protein
MRWLLLCVALAGCGPAGIALDALNIVRPGDEIREYRKANDKAYSGYVGTPEYFGPDDTIDRSVSGGKRPRVTAP